MPSFIQALEDEATQQLEVIRQCRATPTDVTDLRFRAKTALGIIGAFVRLRATMANEKSNELIERRLGLMGDAPRGLTDGHASDAM